jgi:hypothetical protein
MAMTPGGLGPVCNVLKILRRYPTTSALAKVTGLKLPTQRRADAEIIFVCSNGWLAVEVLIKVETPVQVAY